MWRKRQKQTTEKYINVSSLMFFIQLIMMSRIFYIIFWFPTSTNYNLVVIYFIFQIIHFFQIRDRGRKWERTYIHGYDEHLNSRLIRNKLKAWANPTNASLLSLLIGYQPTATQVHSALAHNERFLGTVYSIRYANRPQLQIKVDCHDATATQSYIKVIM